MPIQKTEQPMEPMVMIREHNEQKPRKMSYLFSNREQPMEPMVMIREHNEENQGKCHLYALTEQNRQ